MPARQIANRKSETVLANVVEKTRE